MIRILEYGAANPLLKRSDDRLAQALIVVEPIVDDVRSRGDAAVREYATKFDGLGDSVGTDFTLATGGTLEPGLLQAIEIAASNIRDFAQQQLVQPWTQTRDGRTLGQIVRPLESVGVYIPAGRYALLSTMLMTVIPAQVAGVREIVVVCAKPTPEMLALAKWLGIESILQLGGAQAIAALAYGTESISKVQRIVGPGNAYVAAAKKLVSGDVGIDFIAGPSEIVIVANSGNPQWVALDMLAQCEHDIDARAILLTTSVAFATQVQDEIAAQLSTLPTADVATQSIAKNSAIIVCADDAEVIDLVNDIAPEHLSLPNKQLIDQIRNAGSIFVGPFSTEAAGDYASGPNHVLPTSGVAALRGGLSANDFVKVITIQELNQDALMALVPTVATLARVEGLEAHARSAEVRQ
ncbi:MAG: histidinol dehydrogenase [Acidimicrobiia bacterium BACL6 MAG-120322-bin79]|jgi:histidinol dehydrogenase|nr:MAG: histidinol dehydrogenase [Acidimicrobiia bacterium BACL6 MAG-120322-bin79]